MSRLPGDRAHRAVIADARCAMSLLRQSDLVSQATKEEARTLEPHADNATHRGWPPPVDSRRGVHAALAHACSSECTRQMGGACRHVDRVDADALGVGCVTGSRKRDARKRIGLLRDCRAVGVDRRVLLARPISENQSELIQRFQRCDAGGDSYPG